MQDTPCAAGAVRAGVSSTGNGGPAGTSLRELLADPDLFLIGLGATARDDVLRAVAGALEDKGYVHDSYADAVVAREREYPTGLQTTVGTAIPHADVEHVREPGIAVATLASPVGFTAMGTDDDRVDVRAVFMMAITDADAQVTVLGQLVDVLQDDELLRRLVDVADAGQARDLLDGWTADRAASG